MGSSPCRLRYRASALRHATEHVFDMSRELLNTSPHIRHTHVNFFSCSVPRQFPELDMSVSPCVTDLSNSIGRGMKQNQTAFGRGRTRSIAPTMSVVSRWRYRSVVFVVAWPMICATGLRTSAPST